jgi:hypothetical protein
MTALGPWASCLPAICPLFLTARFPSTRTPCLTTHAGCESYVSLSLLIRRDNHDLVGLTSQPQTIVITIIMSIPRALRPASRRILSARPIVATAVPARWQSNDNRGPFDPVPGHEMAVGELEGAKFRIEPLRRTGEDVETMRARLTCSLGQIFLIFFFFVTIVVLARPLHVYLVSFGSRGAN